MLVRELFIEPKIQALLAVVSATPLLPSVFKAKKLTVEPDTGPFTTLPEMGELAGVASPLPPPLS